VGQRPQTRAPAETAIIWATGGKPCRQLADEHHRLAHPASTAREHTDLKLGELEAQFDHPREQNEYRRGDPQAGRVTPAG
jgi:hypothetical protein